jgi:hypothetical protein
MTYLAISMQTKKLETLESLAEIVPYKMPSGNTSKMVPTGALTTQKDGVDRRRTNNAKRWCRSAH